jgi:hypothetical protein
MAETATMAMADVEFAFEMMRINPILLLPQLLNIQMMMKLIAIVRARTAQ